jgi:AraC-like DNA-binding protein
VDKTVAIVGLVQSLFGIIIFITKRPKHLSFVFLTIWLSVIAVFLGARLLPFQVTDYFKPGIFPFFLLFGPLLYLYVNSLSVEDFRLKSTMLLHMVPLVLVGIHRTIVDPVPIGSQMNPGENTMFIYNKIYYSLIVLSLLIYWIFSLKLILRHRKNIPNQFSNYTSKNSLGWLLSVLTLFLVLFVIDFWMSFFGRVLGFGIGRFSFLSLNLTIFTFIMIFFGINQNAIYKSKAENPVLVLPESSGVQQDKQVRNGMSEKQISDLNSLVMNYLNKDKPYLNPDFSLQMMSDDLKVSRQKLSEVINQGQKKNFYKLINGFRVQEVKEKINNPSFNHYTVLGIGLECGFNSKTSFNRIFKEATGFTPSEFKRNI